MSATNDVAELVAVDRPATANPDLVARWEKGADENEVDRPTVYGGDERGYVDYSFLQAYYVLSPGPRAYLAWGILFKHRICGAARSCPTGTLAPKEPDADLIRNAIEQAWSALGVRMNDQGVLVGEVWAVEPPLVIRFALDSNFSAAQVPGWGQLVPVLDARGS